MVAFAAYALALCAPGAAQEPPIGAPGELPEPVLVRYAAAEDREVTAEWWPLQAPEADAPSVLCVPPGGGERSDLRPLARALRERGIQALLLDPAEPALDGTLSWLEAQGADPTRLGLFGAGDGGDRVLAAAARRPGPFRTAALLAPATDAAEDAGSAPAAVQRATGMPVHRFSARTASPEAPGALLTLARAERIAAALAGDLLPAATLAIPHFAADDPRVGGAGFVAQTRRVGRTVGGTRFELMAFAVGDALTLGAMVQGDFAGSVEWTLGEGTLAFDLVTGLFPEGGVRVRANGEPSDLRGEAAGFRDWTWVNLDFPRARLPLDDAGRFPLRLRFQPRRGDPVSVPGGDAPFAAHLFDRSSQDAEKPLDPVPEEPAGDPVDAVHALLRTIEDVSAAALQRHMDEALREGGTATSLRPPLTEEERDRLLEATRPSVLWDESARRHEAAIRDRLLPGWALGRFNDGEHDLPWTLRRRDDPADVDGVAEVVVRRPTFLAFAAEETTFEKELLVLRHDGDAWKLAAAPRPLPEPDDGGRLPRSDAGEDPWAGLGSPSPWAVHLRLRHWPPGTVPEDRRARLREHHGVEIPRDAAWWALFWKGVPVDHAGAPAGALERLLAEDVDPYLEVHDGLVATPVVVHASADAPHRLLFALVATLTERTPAHPQLRLRVMGRRVPAIHVLPADQRPLLNAAPQTAVVRLPVGAPTDALEAVLRDCDPGTTVVALQRAATDATVQDLVDTWSAVRARGFTRVALDAGGSR